MEIEILSGEMAFVNDSLMVQNGRTFLTVKMWPEISGPK